MNVSREGEGVRLTLDAAEARLLRRALERALFIDTPPEEQTAIAAFCSRALEQLNAPASPSR